MRKSLTALLASALLTTPTGIVAPTAALAQGACIGDVPAGWLRPGGYCDLLERRKSIIEVPGADHVPGTDCSEHSGPIHPLSWTGHEDGAYFTVAAVDDCGEPCVDTSFESDNAVPPRLLFVDLCIE